MEMIFFGNDITHRWYDLVPETFNAHAPAWGKLPRSSYEPEMERNIAGQAKVSVDSFYSMFNTSDLRLFYFPLNQVEIRWQKIQDDRIELRLATNTPSFSHFLWRYDGGSWIEGTDTALEWRLHEGVNLFEAAASNAAGRIGKISTLEIHLSQETGKLFSDDNGDANPPEIKFLFENFDHPKLARLRKKYHLDEVIASAKTDLDRAVILRDWLKGLWDHEQPYFSPPWDAEYVLDHIEKKLEAFYCVHYSVVYMQLCMALGIPARLVNLHRGICAAPLEGRGYGKEMDPDSPCDEHVLNEVWLDDIGKWVVMDVDFDIHYVQEGIPLNAIEIHNLLITSNLAKLSPVEGPHAYKLRSSTDFYQYKLPHYYKHVCLFWRNNHLTDTEGPTRILHWVDEQTPPMLWWEGEDLRHRPQIIGPVGVSWPYSHLTPILTDMNIATHWASSEEPEPHWVELVWDEPQNISSVQILWAKCWGQYFNSRNFEVQVWQDEQWVKVKEYKENTEKMLDLCVFNNVLTHKVRVYQNIHGGSLEFPDRLWIAEIGVN